MASKKTCVFCGNPPNNKNKEHVLPQWLLRMTGDPGRKVYLGRDWSKPHLPKREYSFDNFTFPACESCNTHYSDLEGKAKDVVTKLLERLPVAAADMIHLLDWLDKVRVGLWIGLTTLNVHHRDMTRQFHIDSRVGTRDRLVYVYRDVEPIKGIALAGIESPIFRLMPSCFVLSINNLHLFNVSNNGLLARRMGLPYETSKKLCRDREGYLADVVEGTGAIEMPVVPIPTFPGGAEIYQPIIPREMLASDKGSHYNTPYVRSMCQDATAGMGKVFYKSGNELFEFPTQPGTQWDNAVLDAKHSRLAGTGLMCGEWQDTLYSEVPSMENLTPEQVEYINGLVSSTRRLHETIMNHFRNQVNNLDGQFTYQDTSKK